MQETPKSKEFRECWQRLRDENNAKEEQVMEIKDSILEYQIIINQMKKEYERTIHIHNHSVLRRDG